jgi:hypothetical protein
MIASIFLFIDWYYMLWGMSLMFKFPGYISSSFIGLFFGFVQNINDKIAQFFKNRNDKFN